MASIQPSSLLEARTHYKDLLLEKQNEEFKSAQLEREFDVAKARKHETSEALKESANELGQTLKALKAAMRRRRRAQDDLAATEDAIANIRAAIDQALKTEKSNKKAKPSSAQLKKDQNRLRTERDKLLVEIEDATNDIEITRDVAANLRSEHNDLQKEATEAEEAFVEAEKAKKANNKQIKVLSHSLTNAATKVEHFQIDTDDLKNEWQKVRGFFASHTPPVYLLLRKPQRDIDPVAQRIFMNMREKYNSPEHLATLKRLIQKHGIATECMKVTSRWNKKILTMPYAAVLCLDSSYYTALCMVIQAAGSGVVKEFEDTVGVVEAIRIQQQDQDDGPIIEFARAVVERVAAIKNWQLSDQAKETIASRIYQSLLYR